MGNFFGENDEWKKTKKEMIFLSGEEVHELFNDFEIIQFKDIEKDGLTGMRKLKHWHIIEVVGRKKLAREVK